jgi:hypothetical protein
MLEIIADWELAGSYGASASAIGAGPWKRLAPFSRPRGYGRTSSRQRIDDRPREAYGSNGARSRSSKWRFDPPSVFACAIPLPD